MLLVPTDMPLVGSLSLYSVVFMPEVWEPLVVLEELLAESMVSLPNSPGFHGNSIGTA